MQTKSDLKMAGSFTSQKLETKDIKKKESKDYKPVSCCRYSGQTVLPADKALGACASHTSQLYNAEELNLERNERAIRKTHPE